MKQQRTYIKGTYERHMIEPHRYIRSLIYVFESLLYTTRNQSLVFCFAQKIKNWLLVFEGQNGGSTPFMTNIQIK